MEKNPKVLYRIVNSSSKTRPGVPALNTPIGMTKNAIDAVSALANFFASVFSPKEDLCYLCSLNSVTGIKLCELQFTSEMVAQRLRNLKLSVSPGADGLTNIILEKYADLISRTLSVIFNRSLAEGVVPTDWKRGIISPIYKGGGQARAANYRPVVLIPVISKVMERILAEALIIHLEGNKLLSLAQHGFRNMHSCLTNLLTALNDWTSAVDDRQCVHACYLDISEAFDRVDHKLLLHKLEGHGISGNLLSWLHEYRNSRSVQARVDGALSKDIPVSSGVIQGSVLGPSLFLNSFNDIPKLIRCRILLFADDIKLWVRVRGIDDCSLLQLDLDALHLWSIQNKLPFYFEKCKMIQLGRPYHFSYQLGPHKLNWATREKDLGVWITGSLEPSPNC